MTEQTYNGWANWETRNFMLWYGDDLQMQIDEYIEETEEVTEGQIFEMVEGFTDMLLEEQEMESGFMSDLIGMGFQNLDIHEITQSVLEEHDLQE